MTIRVVDRVDSPDFINVALVTADGEWLVFYQTKYAVGVRFNQNSLAPVGMHIG